MSFVRFFVFGGWGSGCSPAVWTVMSQIFGVSVQCAVLSPCTVKLRGKQIQSDSVFHVNNFARLILVTGTNTSCSSLPFPIFCFYVFVSFSAPHSSPLIQRPLGDSFITMYNEWIVGRLRREEVSEADRAAPDQLQSLPQQLHINTAHTYLILPGFNYSRTLPRRATWAVWRKEFNHITTDVLFRPPQHTATVPSRSLINSCHWSHNQYPLISHVCVTLPSQTVNT